MKQEKAKLVLRFSRRLVEGGNGTTKLKVHGPYLVKLILCLLNGSFAEGFVKNAILLCSKIPHKNIYKE